MSSKPPQLGLDEAAARIRAGELVAFARRHEIFILSDLAYAEAVYDGLVPALLAQGTTTALYFATIHEAASLALARACLAHGQRGFVGLVAAFALLALLYAGAVVSAMRARSLSPPAAETLA